MNDSLNFEMPNWKKVISDCIHSRENTYSLLQGVINRLHISDDEKELLSLYRFGTIYLNELFQSRMRELTALERLKQEEQL